MCLWFTTNSGHAELLRFGFLLTLGLSHHDDLWPDKNRISVSDLYSCYSKKFFMLFTYKLSLMPCILTLLFSVLPLSFLISYKAEVPNLKHAAELTSLQTAILSFHNEFTTRKSDSVQSSIGEHQSILVTMTAVMKDAFVFNLGNNCRIKPGDSHWPSQWREINHLMALFLQLSASD